MVKDITVHGCRFTVNGKLLTVRGRLIYFVIYTSEVMAFRGIDAKELIQELINQYPKCFSIVH